MSRTDRNSELEAIRQDLWSRRLGEIGIGQKAFGVRDSDHRLWQIGREWLVEHGKAGQAAWVESRSDQPDVYLATQLYASGGHTALIGDFVAALADDGPPPQLILTNQHRQNSAPLPEEVRRRTTINSERITVLPGPSLNDCLNQLFDHLWQLRPRRLFLFHHPDDPLGSVVAQPEIAPQRVLVHHADSSPAFGLFLPGIQIIDLHPDGAAMSRLQAVPTELLLLTAPDPGPRLSGFLGRGKLVTASSGGGHKFQGSHVYGYAETVAVILRSTGGWHVHIGDLEDAFFTRIRSALTRMEVPFDRFIHVAWVPSLAAALWEHQCDVYLSSFPIDGARTNAEVVSTSTPHLWHSLRADAERRAAPGLKASLIWRTWEELTTILQRLQDPSVLAEQSRAVRAAYDECHHPQVFAATLKQILRGKGGANFVWQPEIDRQTVNSVLQAVTRNIYAHSRTITNLTGLLQAHAAEITDLSAQRTADVAALEALVGPTSSVVAQVEAQAATLTQVSKRLAELQTVVSRLEHAEAELSRQREEITLLKEHLGAFTAKGQGLRARLRRWLLRGALWR